MRKTQGSKLMDIQVIKAKEKIEVSSTSNKLEDLLIEIQKPGFACLVFDINPITRKGYVASKVFKNGVVIMGLSMLPYDTNTEKAVIGRLGVNIIKRADFLKMKRNGSLVGFLGK